jgi:hypothetical protein
VFFRLSYESKQNNKRLCEFHTLSKCSGFTTRIDSVLPGKLRFFAHQVKLLPSMVLVISSFSSQSLSLQSILEKVTLQSPPIDTVKILLSCTMASSSSECLGRDAEPLAVSVTNWNWNWKIGSTYMQILVLDHLKLIIDNDKNRKLKKKGSELCSYSLWTQSEPINNKVLASVSSDFNH